MESLYGEYKNTYKLGFELYNAGMLEESRQTLMEAVDLLKQILRFYHLTDYVREKYEYMLCALQDFIECRIEPQLDYYA